MITADRAEKVRVMAELLELRNRVADLGSKVALGTTGRSHVKKAWDEIDAAFNSVFDDIELDGSAR